MDNFRRKKKKNIAMSEPNITMILGLHLVVPHRRVVMMYGNLPLLLSNPKGKTQNVKSCANMWDAVEDLLAFYDGR